ncbi:MAG: squalene--hopene cyclase, partial [Planctomycetales bacterium]|nr:squalene--hopene cyclase [Planctomycetales bacterium]
AREAILRGGGADRVNSFTRFYLALLGQIDYRHCPAVPPEAVLLPKWSPINIYRVSAWSRTILVPLAIMWAFRPARELPADLGIDELMLEPPERWPALRCPGRSGRRKFFSWESFFQITDKLLKLTERIGFRPLRRRALSVARQWMLDRFADSDGLGAIFPPIVWSWIALRCLGYENNSPEVRECRRQLEDLMLSDSDDGPVRLQPCKSPVWDTAITLRALAGAGFGANHPDARRAIDWLLDREVRSAGDWSEYVRTEPSGWFFEYRNKFYPDVDDTIMVMMALSDQRRAVESSVGSSVESRANERLENPAELDARMEAACQRARRWTLAMQNRDGGWGAFDRDNDCELLCHVPFADHNAMIDPSTPDITARVLESLAPFGDSPGDTAVERAIAYLRGTQESDGSWYGRWGVNYIYGTWQTIVGLVRIGVPIDDPMIQRAADWLERHQQSNGGWGESARSYEDARYRGRGPATPSQTAWALLGLIAAGRAEHDCVRRGVDYLLAEQRPDGSWDETEFTGTGFPLVFYLRYHMYRIYFPLLALTDWRQAISRDT